MLCQRVPWCPRRHPHRDNPHRAYRRVHKTRTPILEMPCTRSGPSPPAVPTRPTRPTPTVSSVAVPVLVPARLRPNQQPTAPRPWTTGRSTSSPRRISAGARASASPSAAWDTGGRSASTRPPTRDGGPTSASNVLVPKEGVMNVPWSSFGGGLVLNRRERERLLRIWMFLDVFLCVCFATRNSYYFYGFMDVDRCNISEKELPQPHYLRCEQICSILAPEIG